VSSMTHESSSLYSFQGSLRFIPSKLNSAVFSAHYHQASGLTIEMIGRLLGMSAPCEGSSVVDL
jgi:hypothetical protein